MWLLDALRTAVKKIRVASKRVGSGRAILG